MHHTYIRNEEIDESKIELLNDVVESDLISNVYVVEQSVVSDYNIVELENDTKSEEVINNSDRVEVKTVGLDRFKQYHKCSGGNLKVGVMEPVRIEKTEELSNVDIFCSSYLSNFPSDVAHATNVAEIIAGKNEGGSDCVDEIYNARLSRYDESDGLEWFVDNNVNVVNISASLTAHSVYYDIASKYFDYYTRVNLITFVKSSGNDGYDNGEHKITSPGMGYNVITVGATYESGEENGIYSSYVTDSGANKPTVVAPGTLDGSEAWTSYAAPLVTATVANIFDQNKEIIASPHRLINNIVGSADTETTEDKGNLLSNGMYEKVGAGLLDSYTAYLKSEYFYDEDDGYLNMKRM